MMYIGDCKLMDYELFQVRSHMLRSEKQIYFNNRYLCLYSVINGQYINMHTLNVGFLSAFNTISDYE